MVKVIAMINVSFAVMNFIVPISIRDIYRPFVNEMMKGEPLPVLTQLMYNSSSLIVILLSLLSLLACGFCFIFSKKKWSSFPIVISLVLNFFFLFVAFVAMSLPWNKITTNIGG